MAFTIEKKHFNLNLYNLAGGDVPNMQPKRSLFKSFNIDLGIHWGRTVLFLIRLTGHKREK